MREAGKGVAMVAWGGCGYGGLVFGIFWHRLTMKVGLLEEEEEGVALVDAMSLKKKRKKKKQQQYSNNTEQTP